MTQEEIIEMAVQAGIAKDIVDIDIMERFAKLVAEHERERIFGELLKMHEIASSRHNYFLHAVVTIRAKGDKK